MSLASMNEMGAVGKIEELPAQVPAGTRTVVLEMHQIGRAHV